MMKHFLLPVLLSVLSLTMSAIDWEIISALTIGEKEEFYQPDFTALSRVSRDNAHVLLPAVSYAGGELL